MHDLPPDFDPAVFHGKTLDLIGFSANTINLHFDGGLGITVTGAVQFKAVNQARPSRNDAYDKTQTELPLVAGRAVASAVAEDGHTLRLVFDDGSTLWVLGGTEQYEDYTLETENKLIVV